MVDFDPNEAIEKLQEGGEVKVTDQYEPECEPEDFLTSEPKVIGPLTNKKILYRDYLVRDDYDRVLLTSRFAKEYEVDCDNLHGSTKQNDESDLDGSSCAGDPSYENEKIPYREYVSKNRIA